MGIEFLFHELIPLYREELPEDILTKWQPKEILNAILACDPDADKAARYAFGSSGQPGETFQADLVLESKAPNKRMLKDHYHRLGFYLHAPVSMVDPPVEKWRLALENAAACIRAYSQGQILSNIRIPIKRDCICGKTITRNKRGVEATGIMQCHDPKCRAIFDVRFEDGKENFSLRQESFDCQYCRTKNYVSAGPIRDGWPISCVECGKRVVVRSSFQLMPLDQHEMSEAEAAEKMTQSQELEFYSTIGNGIAKKVNDALKPSPTEKAVSRLMGRLVQSGNTMRELIDHATSHDWAWDAVSILRTSFDAMLQAMYILNDPEQSDELATRFLDFHIVERVKILRIYDKNATTLSRRMSASPLRAKNEAGIQSEYNHVCAKYRYDPAKPRPNWYSGNLDRLATIVGYGAEYEIAQKQLSAVLHSSAWGLDGACLTPFNVFRFQWDFAFRVLGRYASILGVALDETEQRLVKQGTENIYDNPALEP